MRLPIHPLQTWAKLFGSVVPPDFDYGEIVQGRTWACTDLDAFPESLPRLRGIDGVVIMEDRDPNFFLSFDHFRPWRATDLNRHGPLHHWSTQQDLQRLVSELHQQQIEVAIGFWNYAGQLRGTLSQAHFFRAHPEIERIPGSSDMDAFSTLREGITYADYIAHQYRKLHETFGFDGLMLGDGFCGYRSMLDPDLYREEERTIPRWTAFYETIATAVHKTKGKLLAYDCLGLSDSEAQRHGVHYQELAKAGLDMLVCQTYPQAWGEYLLSAYRDRFDLDASRIHLKSVKKALTGTETKVFYTVELGDSVEKWRADPEKTKEQVERLDPLADGRFLVWANDLFANIRSTN